MPVTYAGRIEARCVVPTGGAAVSATIANGASAQTATVAAASYYLTAAGGVSSLLTTLQTTLNAATPPAPTTAATIATAIGYGNFATGAGWLMSETSGNLAPSFGSPALTATSLTYRNTGTQTGDYAIGFSTGTSKADGGDVFDVTGTDDFIFAWIGYVSSAPGSIKIPFSKITSAGAGWQINLNPDGTWTFQGYDSGSAQLFLTASASAHAGSWHVGIATIDRATGKARIGTRSLAGSSSVSAESTTAATSMANAVAFRIGDRGDNAGLAATTLQIAGAYVVTGSGVATGLSTNLSTALTNLANAINATWVVSMSTTTGLVSINWSGYATPTWSLSWTSTDLRDLLGFTANISSVTSAQTGTKQARGLWFPDSPLNCDDHPSMAPEDTDLRSTESGTGNVIGLSGVQKYVHTNVRWDRVPVDRIREASATYANASLEVFFRDCISGLGDHAWFRPLSPMQVYWSNAGTDTLLGADANDGAGTDGWCITGLSKFSELAKMSQPGFAGQFNVRLPRLVSEG